MFVDLACDRVHDDCEPFSVVIREQEVGQLLFELVDVFEVRYTCDVLSLIHVNSRWVMPSNVGGSPGWTGQI